MDEVIETYNLMDRIITQTCTPEMTTKFHNNNVYVRCSSNECCQGGERKGGWGIDFPKW